MKKLTVLIFMVAALGCMAQPNKYEIETTKPFNKHDGYVIANKLESLYLGYDSLPRTERMNKAYSDWVVWVRREYQLPYKTFVRWGFDSFIEIKIGYGDDWPNNAVYYVWVTNIE